MSSNLPMQLFAAQNSLVCTVAIVWPTPCQFCISPEKSKIFKGRVCGASRTVSYLQFHVVTCQYYNWPVLNAHSTWPHRSSIEHVHLRCGLPASAIYPQDSDCFSAHAYATHAIVHICLATQSNCLPVPRVDCSPADRLSPLPSAVDYFQPALFSTDLFRHKRSHHILSVEKNKSKILEFIKLIKTFQRPRSPEEKMEFVIHLGF